MMLLCPAPTPSDIAAARAAAGLTQTQAGFLVGYSLRGWQDAESGRRNISAAAWALFLLATGQHPGYMLARQLHSDSGTFTSKSIEEIFSKSTT